MKSAEMQKLRMHLQGAMDCLDAMKPDEDDGGSAPEGEPRGGDDDAGSKSMMMSLSKYKK